MTVTRTGARGDEGALAAVLPAAARRLWVDDHFLRDELGRDGYDIVATDPHAVVVTDAKRLAEAPRAEVVVVLLDGTQAAARRGGRLHDAAARVRAHARVRADARAAHRALGRLGHREVRLLTWDHNVGLAEPRGRAAPRHRPEAYPRRAVLVTGEPSEPTVLAVAAQQAGLVRDPSSSCPPPAVSPGGSVLLHGERVLLRVGLGQGRQQVEGPASVLAALGQGATGSAVTTRVPSLLAQGRAGAASWSLEQRMPGASPPLPFDAGLLDDCVEFLAVLHKAPCAAGQHGTDITSAAAGVGRLTRHGALVRRLAARAVENVHDLPRGFGHRDFWHRNLLAQDGRLTGVVDWDSAAGGTLPFLDLMHLVATQPLRPGGHMLGRALVEVLLPWAERGGDVHAERYAAALGVSTRAPQLRALVTVYWLEWLDYQLSHYAERRRDQRWLRGNVELVVDALAA